MGDEERPVRASIWIVVLSTVTLCLIGFFIFIQDDEEAESRGEEALTVEAEPEIQNHSPEPLPPLDLPEEEFDFLDDLAPPLPQSGPPPASEMETAAVVPGDPLIVTIPSRSELGPISIERYDSEGNPTGEPLPTGTQVQIPDPNLEGGKIYFRTP
ncbi:MAG: hypothetical protein AAF236_16220 [Verrucomicrobiota bacterium]